MFIDFHAFSSILLALELGVPGACGWQPVAACDTGVVALLEDCIMEACTPGPGDLEPRMMRLRVRMLMNDERDEDYKKFPHAQAWGARRILPGGVPGSLVPCASSLRFDK